MADRDALLAELAESREQAAALVRAKLDAVANYIHDLANRAVGELQVVLPPDLEVLFPLAPFGDRLAAVAKPSGASSQLSLDMLRKLDAGRAQSEVLQQLLAQVDSWCGERAIVVFREGQVNGWASAGFSAGDPARGWRGTVAESPALVSAVEGTPALVVTSADSLLSSWFGRSNRQVLIVPMALRTKIVGAFLASEGKNGLDIVMVQLLVFLTALLLETLSARTTVPSAALKEPVKFGAAPMSAQESDGFSFGGEESAIFAPSTVVSVVPKVAPARTVESYIPEVVDASATLHVKIPTPTTRSPEDERKNEEARRFARLLVSEIRLYNEQAVQEGKQTRDIYQRLKEDVDRSQEMYEQRVPAEVRASSNYFFDELVRILADGDSDALGL